MSNWFDGYDDLLSDVDDSRHRYDVGTPNWKRGRTLLVANHELKEAIDFAADNAGEYTDKGRKLPFLMSRASVHHIDACFTLIRNELYNPTRTHFRYLFELYLLLKGLNEDRERSAEIYDDVVDQLHNDSGESLLDQKLATVNPFDKIVDEQREDLKGSTESKLLWNNPSWSAVHPYSLESIDLDLEYDEFTEGQLLDMANTFVFGVGAQLVRTWGGTEFFRVLLEKIDSMFVRVRLATRLVPPRMFGDDLEYWFGGTW